MSKSNNKSSQTARDIVNQVCIMIEVMYDVEMLLWIGDDHFVHEYETWRHINALLNLLDQDKNHIV